MIQIKAIWPQPDDAHFPQWKTSREEQVRSAPQIRRARQVAEMVRIGRKPISQSINGNQDKNQPNCPSRRQPSAPIPAPIPILPALRTHR